MRTRAIALVVALAVSAVLASPAAGAPSETVLAFGAAPFLGSTGTVPLNAPLVDLAATPTATGYWQVAADGGVFAFGDAAFHGSTGGLRLNQPVVGMAATPSGDGYWLVAADGGVFAFGDATFHGSTGGLRLNQPVVGMAGDPDGAGYWLAAADGGVFAFDAPFQGSTAGALPVGDRVVGLAAAPGGYWIATANGLVVSHGSLPHLGGPDGGALATTDVAAIEGLPSADGYWLALGPRPRGSVGVRADGVGPIRMGMTVAQAGAAAGAPLVIDPTGSRSPDVCGWATTAALPGVVFMVTDRTTVARADITDPSVRTSEGVGIRTTEADLLSVFGARLRLVPIARSDHRYYVLAGPAPYALVFEIRQGLVESYWVGHEEVFRPPDACQ